jgi:hypothetical protein
MDNGLPNHSFILNTRERFRFLIRNLNLSRVFKIMTYISISINTEDPTDDVDNLGVSNTFSDAVDNLIVRAHYRTIDGKFTQYFKPTTDYDSMDVLRSHVTAHWGLYDAPHIYRIVDMDGGV